MGKRKKLVIGGIVLASAALLFVVLGRQEEGPPSDRELSPAEEAGGAVVDCTTDSSRCSEIIIQGDPPSTSGAFRTWSGYADPSIRKDPASSRLWMAYSWLHLEDSRPAVSTHLASSDDGGSTWQFARTLWAAEEAANPLNGEAGHMSNEVPNILPVQTPEGVVWYGARQRYFVPEDGGLADRPLHSFRIHLSRADSLQGLVQAPSAALAGANTEEAWGIDARLSGLSPEVEDCEQFSEPGLFMQGGTLYLSLACVEFGFQWRTSTAVFATEPEGAVGDWSWRYVGGFAGEELREGFGTNSVSQGDLTTGQDGQVLAVFTPAQYPTGLGKSVADIRHHGCRIAEVASLEPFRLARDGAGNVTVRVVVTSSDSVGQGNGACAYDPASSTGVLIVRRAAFSPGNVLMELFETGVKP